MYIRIIKTEAVEGILRRDLVIKSFVEYCQHDYASGKAWVHPITGQICTKEIIKANYLSLIKEEPAFKTPLCEIFARVELSLLVKRTGMHSNTLNRKLRRAISLLICMSLHPELNPHI